MRTFGAAALCSPEFLAQVEFEILKALVVEFSAKAQERGFRHIERGGQLRDGHVDQGVPVHRLQSFYDLSFRLRRIRTNGFHSFEYFSDHVLLLSVSQ